MKPTIYGKINAVFSKELSHSNKDLAMLETGYKIDDSVAEKVELVITNIYGEKTIVKVEDWNVELTDVVDEDGLLVW